MFSKLDNFQLSLLIGHFDSSLHWMRFGFLLWFRFLHLNMCTNSDFGLSKISVNLFDGQFTCWAICLKYHILTYGHITAGPPANISFCVWGVAADDNDRNAIDDDDYDGDDDDESDLKIWVAPAASTAAVTRSFPPTATGSTLRLLVMMMIVVVLMMAMVVMVVTKRLTTEIMKVIKMIMLLAFGCWLRLLAAGLSSRCLPISGWAPAFGGLPFVAAENRGVWCWGPQDSQYSWSHLKHKNNVDWKETWFNVFFSSSAPLSCLCNSSTLVWKLPSIW